MIDSKQAELEGVQRQTVGLTMISPGEREQLDTTVKDLHVKHAQLKDRVNDMKKQLSKGISDREVIRMVIDGF